MNSPTSYDRVASTPTTPTNEKDGNARRGCCAPRRLGWSLIVAGGLVAVIAVVYGAALPPMIDSQVRSGVALCDASDYQEAAFLDAYGDCDDCAPYYYSLRMFNASNALEYLQGGVKLKLQEFGPYTYRRWQKRVDVRFDAEADPTRVSYKQYTYHTFDASQSCAGCSDADEFVSFDVGYLNVMAQAGGEAGFLTRLALGSFATNESEAADAIALYGPQMMRWVNGLNSLDPAAMKNVASGGLVLRFLATGPAAIADLEMQGFAYNGVFAKRSIRQWALGYPSLLAGLALGSNYVSECNATDGSGIMAQCVACQEDESLAQDEACLALWSACAQCATGAGILAINDHTCGLVGDVYAAEYGAEEAASFMESTCGLCDSFGLCAAPLPGIAEDSGLDYSTAAPDSASLQTYTQRTGCDDDSQIGVYERYNGYSQVALWVDSLTERRNPTLQEIADFATYYGNCERPTANLSCSPVRGNDATGVAPGGANMLGFAKHVSVDASNMYLDQGKQNITLWSRDTEVELAGITLHRFGPPNDLLNATPESAALGTGFPVDGVQPLAFTVGFLAYVSYPAFLFGDRSLTDSIELTMSNGVVASYESMYDLDAATGEYALKDEYVDMYVTYVDIEAGTGKSMAARKRLMASYGLAKSRLDNSLPMTDVLWPDVETDVVLPAYFGEEFASVTDTQSDYYHLIKRILVSTLPVLIVGAVVGLAALAFGVVRLRRHGKDSAGASKTPAGMAI